MRFALVFPGVVLALLMGLGCAAPESQSIQVDASTHETRVYEVYGMNCPACHGGVEKLVKKIPGVLTARADWTKKRIEVTVDRQVDVTDEAIGDAVKRANFTPGKQLQ